MVHDLYAHFPLQGYMHAPASVHSLIFYVILYTAPQYPAFLTMRPTAAGHCRHAIHIYLLINSFEIMLSYVKKLYINLSLEVRGSSLDSVAMQHYLSPLSCKPCLEWSHDLLGMIWWEWLVSIPMFSWYSSPVLHSLSDPHR